MSFTNHLSKEINCKVVYYGPGLCGKTTNLQYIHDHTNPGNRGKMISLATETDRTLFFDFMPLDLGSIGGFKIRFHLYTVPGQVFYEATRKLILKGTDGIIFVADAQEARLEANMESIENLHSNLAEHGFAPGTMPCVIQYNKIDLPTCLPIEELRAAVNPANVPEFTASALTGQGVFETLKGAAKLILVKLRQTGSTNR